MHYYWIIAWKASRKSKIKEIKLGGDFLPPKMSPLNLLNFPFLLTGLAYVLPTVKEHLPMEL
ncbi:hypothetical protein LX64_05193 [Chitinophaga skermanii]|uniref:Uncharacterized protein n=1 Tax=Chitinophaga skermanii TaxID=331697 RepID=A0A327PZS2_9BACT|nr:hypothetical protein LX64_05193 [Chitinophaga skermanii]